MIQFRWVVVHEFERHGWRVEPVYHGTPMAHDEKYLLINQGFAGKQRLMPFFNRTNNEDLILAIQSAGVSRGRNGSFLRCFPKALRDNRKDKSGEKLAESEDHEVAAKPILARTPHRRHRCVCELPFFDKAPYMTLSMTRPDGTPYGLPLNVARRDETTFYFHCSAGGEKIDCLKHNPVVSLLAVSRCTPKYEEEKNNFTEYYSSAIAIGRAEFVADRNEKIEALRLICERFLPNYMEYFDEAITRSLDRTTVVKIILTEPPVGKCKP